MKFKLIQIAMLLYCFPFVFSGQEGKEIFTFLRIPTSSHANALGGNSVSLVERDPSLVFHNPALLGSEMDGMLNLNYMNYISDINIGSVIYAKAFKEKGAWSIGAHYINYGSLKEVTSENVVTGNFSINDLILNATYTHDLSERWRGGLTLKIIYSNLADYSSFGIAVDAGLSYYNPEKEFSYGIVLKNIGAQLKSYESQRGKIPWDIQMGLTKKMDHAPLRFSITAMYLNKWKLNYIDDLRQDVNDNFINTLAKHLIFGVDIVPSDNFWLGIGFNPKANMDLKLKEGGNGLGGFSIGAGLKVSKLDVNLSAARYHPSAISIMLSASTCLNDFTP